MSQRVKRPNRTDDGCIPTKRRKRPTMEEEEAASLAAAASWQPRPFNDLKSIYNRTATEAPAELFRKDLISAMKLPDSEPLALDEYWIIVDQWKQEWERGVQVPVNPDSLPEPSVTVNQSSTIKPHHEFKIPKTKYIRITKDEHFHIDKHVLSTAPAKAEAACSYDLDETDVAWLKLLNGERAACGLNPISEEKLERVIERLEINCWDKIQSILRNEEGLGIEYDENVICDVCRSPDSEEGNEMVFCDSCNICVHQACYGITRIPEGQWLCGTCALSQRPECVLCPNKGGAMKATRSGQKWAHVSCALWIPEVSIGCVEKMEPITKVSSIPQSRWALICVLCRERVGACIQCSVKTCKTAYHVTCAFKHGLEMRAIIEDENADDGVKLRSYCEKHSKTSKKEKSICSGSEDDDNKRKKRKDMTSEEKNQARAARLHEIEAEFDKHVNIKDVNIRLDVDAHALQYIYNYWKLKRRAGNNKPLLPPKSEDVDMLSHKQEQADLEKMKMFVQLRQDLERVRNLCYMVSRREKLSRTFFRMREQTFYKQAAVLESSHSLSTSVTHAVFEANHGPSIYDRLYSHSDAEDHKDFDVILARIAGIKTKDEKKPEINGLLKSVKKDNPYKRTYFNGSSKRRSVSLYGSSTSGGGGDSSDEQRFNDFKDFKSHRIVHSSNNSSSADEKPSATPLKRKAARPRLSKKRRKHLTSRSKIDSSSEEDVKVIRKSRLQQVKNDLGMSGTESDELHQTRSESQRSKVISSIYSESDSSNGSNSQQSRLRTKAAVKEFLSKPSTSKNPSKTSPPTKKKSKPIYIPSDLIVPQREAAKKASENLKSSTTRIVKESTEVPPALDVKPSSPDVKAKPVKTKTKDVKLTPKREKNIDVFDIENEKEDEILSYVPQRQAAKKATESIKSGLGKPIPPASDNASSDKDKPSDTTTKPAKIQEHKRKSSTNTNSSTSSSASSSSDSSDSSSTESDVETNKPQSESLSAQTKRATTAKDWPFLDKVAKSEASSSNELVRKKKCPSSTRTESLGNNSRRRPSRSGNRDSDVGSRDILNSQSLEERSKNWKRKSDEMGESFKKEVSKSDNIFASLGKEDKRVNNIDHLEREILERKAVRENSTNKNRANFNKLFPEKSRSREVQDKKSYIAQKHSKSENQKYLHSQVPDARRLEKSAVKQRYTRSDSSDSSESSESDPKVKTNTLGKNSFITKNFRKQTKSKCKSPEVPNKYSRTFGSFPKSPDEIVKIPFSDTRLSNKYTFEKLKSETDFREKYTNSPLFGKSSKNIKSSSEINVKKLSSEGDKSLRSVFSEDFSYPEKTKHAFTPNRHHSENAILNKKLPEKHSQQLQNKSLSEKHEKEAFQKGITPSKSEKRIETVEKPEKANKPEKHHIRSKSPEKLSNLFDKISKYENSSERSGITEKHVEHQKLPEKNRDVLVKRGNEPEKSVAKRGNEPEKSVAKRGNEPEKSVAKRGNEPEKQVEQPEKNKDLPIKRGSEKQQHSRLEIHNTPQKNRDLSLNYDAQHHKLSPELPEKHAQTKPSSDLPKKCDVSQHKPFLDLPEKHEAPRNKSSLDLPEKHDVHQSPELPEKHWKLSSDLPEKYDTHRKPFNLSEKYDLHSKPSDLPEKNDTHRKPTDLSENYDGHRKPSPDLPPVQDLQHRPFSDLHEKQHSRHNERDITEDSLLPEKPNLPETHSRLSEKHHLQSAEQFLQLPEKHERRRFSTEISQATLLREPYNEVFDKPESYRPHIDNISLDPQFSQKYTDLLNTQSKLSRLSENQSELYEKLSNVPEMQLRLPEVYDNYQVPDKHMRLLESHSQTFDKFPNVYEKHLWMPEKQILTHEKVPESSSETLRPEKQQRLFNIPEKQPETHEIVTNLPHTYLKQPEIPEQQIKLPEKQQEIFENLTNLSDKHLNMFERYSELHEKQRIPEIYSETSEKQVSEPGKSIKPLELNDVVESFEKHARFPDYMFPFNQQNLQFPENAMGFSELSDFTNNYAKMRMYTSEIFDKREQASGFRELFQPPDEYVKLLEKQQIPDKLQNHIQTPEVAEIPEPKNDIVKPPEPIPIVKESTDEPVKALSPPPINKDGELLDFDMLEDGFGISKAPLAFSLGNVTLFKEDSKEDSARETLNLVEKLRMELSKKSSNHDVDDTLSIASATATNRNETEEPVVNPPEMHNEEVPKETIATIQQGTLDPSTALQADERWVPPSNEYPFKQYPLTETSDSTLIQHHPGPYIEQLSPSPYADIHPQAKWADSQIMPTRRSSSSSAASSSSSCSQTNEERPDVMVMNHPNLEMQFGGVLQQFQSESYSTQFSDPQFINPISLFPPPTQIPFPSAGATIFPPVYHTPKPLESTICTAAFTSSEHNMALTAAMVNLPTPTESEPLPVTPTALTPVESEVTPVETEPTPVATTPAQIESTSPKTTVKKSPGKPTRTSARFHNKSPEKSPRTIPEVPKTSGPGRGRGNDKRGGVRGLSRGRGRGRGRGKAPAQQHQDYDGNTINKLVGTVYDFDFDDENDSMGDLKSMRERRKSSDVHTQSPKLNDIISPKLPTPPVKNVSPPPPPIVEPVLPGPVDMRTYSNFDESQSYRENNLLSALGGTTEPAVHEDIDEDFGKVGLEIANNIKASLSDSRNQLKVKIKGPIANYTATVPPPSTTSNTNASNVINNVPVEINSGTSNLRRMRKKELLRQYWTQENMDDNATVPGIAAVPTVVPINRTIITIPKAVASMTSIPTRDDYRDYRTGTDEVVENKIVRKEPKARPGALSRELKQLDLPIQGTENATVERRRNMVRGKLNKTAPKLKIKIGGNHSIITDPTKERIKPPKKRLSTIAQPNVEDLKRESMKFRKMVMADFAEIRKKKKDKSSKHRKRKNQQVEIVSNDDASSTKLIIRFNRKADSECENTKSNEEEVDKKINNSVEVLKDSENNVRPIKLKLARCQAGSGYMMKTEEAPRLPEPPIPLPLNKDCEVR